jgi:hypothetical protein
MGNNSAEHTACSINCVRDGNKKDKRTEVHVAPLMELRGKVTCRRDDE